MMIMMVMINDDHDGDDDDPVINIGRVTKHNILLL
jgi:hypothetical protein